uniref:Uncharacterized protein n=1 Tax=Wuchereria bancrofti TaxID=6293 RepID=A0AAF5PK01_WUCBA
MNGRRERERGREGKERKKSEISKTSIVEGNISK